MKVANFFGGLPIEQNKKLLKEDPPHIVVGTPGRVLALSNMKLLVLSHVRHFILDECDKMLESFGEKHAHSQLPLRVLQKQESLALVFHGSEEGPEEGRGKQRRGEARTEAREERSEVTLLSSKRMHCRHWGEGWRTFSGKPAVLA